MPKVNPNSIERLHLSDGLLGKVIFRAPSNHISSLLIYLVN
ncbi:12047_t:CDS:2 [Dentiscutata erythropus]|uniref:12047_t:CDS:1 n=1 Tax=Dentiscutata erythropus TaxID=1348616 RepID=A0A9N8WH73_9GLOM|nr:12047_t:CDS:2 [Dentiscutata erythropus]